MGWVKDRQNTQKPKTEQKKTKESRTHHPKQNSSNVLSVSLLDQVYGFWGGQKHKKNCPQISMEIRSQKDSHKSPQTDPKSVKSVPKTSPKGAFII